MKNKKVSFITLLTMTLIIVMSLFGSVQAASGNRTFNITMKRPSGYGYQLARTRKNIWKIYDTEKNNNDTIYCLRGGPGFGSTDMSNAPGTGAVQYKEHFELKQKETIPTKYQTALKDISDYNALMWILDNIYVAPKVNASQEQKETSLKSKEALLQATLKYAEETNNPNYDDIEFIINKGFENGYDKGFLTDDDIDATQQLAVWYYTNPSGDYHTDENFEFWLNKIKDNFESEYTEITAVMPGIGEMVPRFPFGEQRLYTCQAIFKYLTETPQKAGFKYDYKQQMPDTSNMIDKNTKITIEKDSDRLVVGPYKINKLENIDYLIDAKWFDGTGKEIKDVRYLNRSKQQIKNMKSIKDISGQEFYISVPNNINRTKIELKVNGNYFVTETEYWSVENPGPTDQPIVIINKDKKDFADNRVYEEIIEEKTFDLALRKYITKINGVNLQNTRQPNIDESTLKNGTTALYKHRKDPVLVKTGDKVTYNIAIYNEGEKAGRATKIIDQLPTGLKFVRVVSGNFEVDGYSETDNTLKLRRKPDNKANLPAYTENNLKSEIIEIECEVIKEADTEKDKILTNVAWIVEEIDEEGKIIDRDSQPEVNPGKNKDNMENYSGYGNIQDLSNSNNYYKGQQDDDDFEKLIIKAKPKEPEKEIDLALRKFINSVEDNGKSKEYNREPIVDTSKLENKTEKTAIYNHTKEPVGVSEGNIVTYTIRVYNEGEEDGYVTEITDFLPPQLEFLPNDELNAKYAWQIVEGSKGRKVYTNITSNKTENIANRDMIYEKRSGTDKVLLKAFNGKDLDYIDVQIRCKVKDSINLFEKITNIAEITGFTDAKGNTIKDRDSAERNTVIPEDIALPQYKDTEIESKKTYIPGQEDDDDFEKLEVKRFDLALRKFITGVSTNDKLEEIKNRVPVFSMEDGKYSYTHTKEPVNVANGNTVIYTLRVFNEGNVAGYAQEIKDDIPDGLEFLPENEINTAFRWKMYKEDGTETKNVKEAKTIKTDYLSKEQEKVEGDRIIKEFNPETMEMPDFKEVKVAFKVAEPNTSDRIIVNTAEISNDADKNGNPVEDVDSTPNNNDPKEDDIDIEKIKVQYFDLSLKKWVTESIVTYDGKTTVTKTGHTGDENPEAPAKVDLNKRKLSKTTVKFKFNIKVKNEGEIAGYVKELVDYVPEGLKFVKADNPKWREENGKILTNQLKDKLLKPGETATVDIVLTWINDKNNMGLKENWAEIYEDYNDPKSPDIDSTPGNNKKGEDDIDKAPVVLSIMTGGEKTYITLTISCILILAGGIILIKKYVI